MRPLLGSDCTRQSVKPVWDVVSRGILTWLYTISKRNHVAITPETLEALKLLRQASKVMPDADASVFGLSMSQISRRVDGMARVAGLGDGYSSHSGRVGLAVKGGDKTCQRGGDKL